MTSIRRVGRCFRPVYCRTSGYSGRSASRRGGTCPPPAGRRLPRVGCKSHEISPRHARGDGGRIRIRLLRAGLRRAVRLHQPPTHLRMSHAASSVRASPAIAVVGAGIVGAAAAYVLCKRGAHVTLIDRADPGRGCSYGNAGALSPGSVAPLAMPGILMRAPRMLLDPEGPLHLPLSYLPRALPWLARFVAASRPERVDAIAARLAALHANAIEHHVALAKEVGAGDLVRRRGHLHVYPDAASLAKDAAVVDAAPAVRRSHRAARPVRHRGARASRFARATSSASTCPTRRWS